MSGSDSAFPKSELCNDPGGIGTGILHEGGLTKREFVAVAAMQGMLGLAGRLKTDSPLMVKTSICKETAENSVMMADALLVALGIEPEGKSSDGK